MYIYIYIHRTIHLSLCLFLRSPGAGVLGLVLLGGPWTRPLGFFGLVLQMPKVQSNKELIIV